MVVEEQEGSIAIVGDGAGGYLVVEIIEKCATYAEAKEVMEEALEDDDDGDDTLDDEEEEE